MPAVADEACSRLAAAARAVCRRRPYAPPTKRDNRRAPSRAFRPRHAHAAHRHPQPRPAGAGRGSGARSRRRRPARASSAARGRRRRRDRRRRGPPRRRGRMLGVGVRREQPGDARGRPPITAAARLASVDDEHGYALPAHRPLRHGAGRRRRRALAPGSPVSKVVVAPLFGDGAGAVVMRARPPTPRPGSAVRDALQRRGPPRPPASSYAARRARSRVTIARWARAARTGRSSSSGASA